VTCLLHCHQRRSKPRPEIICTENFVKFGHEVFETRERSEQTDRYADTLIASVLRTLPQGGSKNRELMCPCGVQMRTLTIHAFLIVFLMTSALVCVCLAHLRVGAFNAHTFGRSKVADEDVLRILVQVCFSANSFDV